MSNGEAKVTFSVTVSSPYGKPNPANGVVNLDKGPQTLSVTSPDSEEKEAGGIILRILRKKTGGIISWKKVWVCTGWTGTGDIPSKGVGTSVTFPLTQDSTITWNWVGSQLGNQILSIVAVAFFIAVGLVTAYLWPHAFFVAISAGALGGLAHEIVQSGGKYILPTTDATGNFCLGGLIGIITGGIAGLLTYQGLLGTVSVTVSAKLAVAALIAGLAVKGIADAPNPK